MKVSIRIATTGLALLMSSSLAYAQAAKSHPSATPPAKKSAMGGAEMPKPSPELAKVNWMVGQWSCTGKAFASPMGPEHPVAASVRVAWEPGKFWLHSEYREKKTPQNPMPVAADEFWGHDGKAWVRLALDNMGGWSKGAGNWENDKIAWMSEGPMGGQTMKFRDTFTKKGEREIGYVGEMGASEASLARAWEINCKK
jgi:hypothetical protein